MNNTGLLEQASGFWTHGNDAIPVHSSNFSQHKTNTGTLISQNKQTNKRKKTKQIKARWHPLQYSAGFFFLEGVVWSRDARKERVISGVFGAVVHKVCRGLGYLYPLNARLYSQLVHCPSGMGNVIGRVKLWRHPGRCNTGRCNVQSGIAVSPSTEAKLSPSTDWEETFPSARSLTAQCQNYTNVFTPQTVQNQLSGDLAVDFKAQLSLSADVKS